MQNERKNYKGRLKIEIRRFYYRQFIKAKIMQMQIRDADASTRIPDCNGLHLRKGFSGLL